MRGPIPESMGDPAQEEASIVMMRIPHFAGPPAARLHSCNVAQGPSPAHQQQPNLPPAGPQLRPGALHLGGPRHPPARVLLRAPVLSARHAAVGTCREGDKGVECGGGGRVGVAVEG